MEGLTLVHWLLIGNFAMLLGVAAFIAALRKQQSDDARIFEQKIEHLFLAAVSRKPTKTEQKRAQELLKQRNDQPELALEDIWWALLNSNEFLSDH